MRVRRSLLWGLPLLILITAAAGLARARLSAAGHELPQQARDILEEAESLEVFSLDPLDERMPGKGFHGWTVLGQTTVQSKAGRRALIDALNRGVRESEGQVAECFIPRHGVRAVSGGKTLDLVICFECLQIEVSLEGETSTTLTTGSPQQAFDRLLNDAGVPLASPAH